MDILESRLRVLEESPAPTNAARRRLFSELELLRLELDALGQGKGEGLRGEGVWAGLQQRVEQRCRSLALVPKRGSGGPLQWLDMANRTLAVCLAFVTYGAVLSLPILAMAMLDQALLLPLGLVDARSQPSEAIRRFIGYSFLLLTGIFVLPEGLEHLDTLQSSCWLLTFTHASNLDGFLVSMTCPVRHYALAKKEVRSLVSIYLYHILFF